MHKVFVYGTLKQGYHNHYLLEGCKFEEAEAEGFNLHASAYLPYAVPGEGTIKGELYEVDNEVLKRLDRLEGHPRYYRRIKTSVRTALEQIEAWLYICPSAARYPIIGSGNWEVY